MQQNEQRPALRHKKSLTQLLGLGKAHAWPSTFPAMPARATEIIQTHQGRDQEVVQSALKDSCSTANNNTRMLPRVHVLDDAFRTPTKPQTVHSDRRNFSFNSDTYSDYFVPTPTPKAKVRKPPKALRAVKSMDTFRSTYPSLSIMTSERSPSPTDGYMSMQELLSSRGFTDTRIITPETFKARAAQAKRPAAQTIFSKSADQVPTLSSTADSLHPLRPKQSLVGMLGSLWTASSPPLDSLPAEEIPASPTSISSRASNSSLGQEEVVQTSPIEPEAQQHRTSTWVRSTSEHPTRPISPISTKSDRSIRSARSFASLSQPAAPALCLDSLPNDDKTPTTTTTFARPNEDLRRRLRHAVSVPIFADPPIETRPPLPEQKSLRKTTSTTAMMRSKPLQPVLSTATPASTRVLKLPSPDRLASVEPKGVRSDVRNLFESPCKTKMEKKAQGDKRASSTLKTLLGKSEKSMPFVGMKKGVDVGMKLPAGIQRLGKGVKSWDVEDLENRPLRRVDRI